METSGLLVELDLDGASPAVSAVGAHQSREAPGESLGFALCAEASGSRKLRVTPPAKRRVSPAQRSPDSPGLTVTAARLTVRFHVGEHEAKRLVQLCLLGGLGQMEPPRTGSPPVEVIIGAGATADEARKLAAELGHGRAVRTSAEVHEAAPALHRPPTAPAAGKWRRGGHEPDPHRTGGEATARVDVVQRYLPNGPVDVNRIPWEVREGVEPTRITGNGHIPGGDVSGGRDGEPGAADSAMARDPA